ncbi:MAG: sigma-70 family RNA polymerase sigma factor [Deltaproteobacteria bacterium]|nr:sigma-70 family RNA polymerase sigma factor [Deltaproteobacteria bacterium]
MPSPETFIAFCSLILGTVKFSEESWEEDARLVSLLKKGEREAFAQLVTKYQQDIYKLAYFKLWNQAEAEDAAQEAFVRSLAAIRSLRDGKKYFGFLKTIALNCCNDMITHKIREGDPLPEYESNETTPINIFNPGSPEEIAGQKEIIDQVKKALDKLDEAEKEIVILKHYQELTFQQIAVRLGIPENTAKTNFYRTLEKLARTLQSLRGEH